MEKFDLQNKCYQTKDDKRHNTIFAVDRLNEETPEEREQRLKTLRENKGTWVWDETRKEVIRKEDYIPKEKNIDAPLVSRWDSEWSVVATGKRMSKGELKRYCKTHGKIWEN